jgi:hypothetical protein
MSPVKYEQGFYISEDAILHSHCSGNLKSYMCFEVLIYSNNNIPTLMHINKQ